jgi:hypothetical protein
MQKLAKRDGPLDTAEYPCSGPFRATSRNLKSTICLTFLGRDKRRSRAAGGRR